MACMMAIFSQIKIDLPGYVPITLQTFMVCLIALIAPCKVAVSACVVYLLMGAVGLPVFAGFQGGMGSLLGYSGGYIFSFPIMVYVISKLKTRVPIGLACIIGSCDEDEFKCIFNDVCCSFYTWRSYKNSISLLFK